MILELFGYDKNEWEVIQWTFGKYEVAIKEEDVNRECITVRARIRPKLKKELDHEQYLEVIRDVLKDSIKPYKIQKVKSDKN